MLLETSGGFYYSQTSGSPGYIINPFLLFPSTKTHQAIATVIDHLLLLYLFSRKTIRNPFHSSSPTPYFNRSCKPSSIEAAMSSAGRLSSWIAAASISAVEALKDQGGLCRWNYALRSLHQKAKREMGFLTQSTKTTPSSSSSSSSSSSYLMAATRGMGSKAEQAKRAEESLRKVMYLSCWGPY